MEYTVDVKETGIYTFDAEVAASREGGVFHIAEYGLDNLTYYSDFIMVPSTGSTTNYQTLHSVLTKELTAGRLARNPEGRLLPVPGTEKTMPCDLLLIAAGFVGCEDETLRRFSLAADQRGRLLPADGSHRVGGKLFSAGDMRTGQSLVVRALADGRAAAREVNQWLGVSGS